MALTLSPKMSIVQIVGRLRVQSAIACGGQFISWAEHSSAVNRSSQGQRSVHNPGLQTQLAGTQFISGHARVKMQTFQPLHLYTTQASSNQSQDFLVYEGRVSNMLRALKIFSISTSAIGLSLQPYLMITYQDMSLAAAVPFFAAINIFVFINPILIHLVAKKYVTQLFFNPVTKVFTANFWTFFARKESLTFTADDVKVPDMPGMFAMLTVKGRPLFVNESDFTSLEVYKHLMKFDQPLDITYSPPEKKEGE